MARASDTTVEAHRVQRSLLRALPPERRVEMALEMSEEARAITMAGIRGRHPEYTDQQARHALFRLILGDETFRLAWPKRPLLDP